MNEFIQEMSELYKKIQDGNANDEEKFIFEFKLLLSCMNREMLMYLIEIAAKEKSERKGENNG